MCCVLLNECAFVPEAIARGYAISLQFDSTSKQYTLLIYVNVLVGQPRIVRRVRACKAVLRVALLCVERTFTKFYSKELKGKANQKTHCSV